MNSLFSPSFKAAACAAFLGLAAASALKAASAPAVTSLGALTDAIQAPSRVATDSAGRTYVTDPRAGQVVVNDAFGRLVAVKTGLGTPLGIAVSPTGIIYVGDQATGSVSVFDSSWTALGKLGAGNGEFLLPNYIAVDASGNVLVCDSAANKVKVYTGGTLTRTVGSKGSGNGQFNFPAGLWVNATGDLFVVDQINDRVVVFNAAGVFQRAFTLRPTGVTGLSGRAQGLAGDGAGRVFVADSFQGTVKAFDASSGVFLSKIGAFGEVAGRLATPAGVAVDAQGRLFVASSENGRVEVFGLDCFTQLSATPDNQLVPLGGTASFTATVGCAGSLSYQWRKDGVDITDATNAALTIASVAAGDAGLYTVVVTGPGGAQTSPAAQLVVVTPPVIGQDPSSLSVAEGSPAGFTVQATGLGLTYQWRFDGIAIVGATTSAFNLASALSSAQGTYSVVVANPAGSVTSAGATLTVVDAPVISTQPTGLTVAERGSAAFVGSAAGSPTIGYQWYYNGAVMSGRTTPSLLLTNLSPSANGAYYFTAANAAGSATSQVAVLNVLPDTVAPVALSAAGGTATNTTISVMFSKTLDAFSAQTLANYEVQGPGGITVVSATLNNGTNVVLGLSSPRAAGANYSLVVHDVTDAAYLHNVLAPNPTTLVVSSYIELIGINSTPWKFLQVTNNVMDAQPWKTVAFDDSAWASGFGIFYGNRSNSVYQPNPNPNVILPFSLSSSDTNRTKVNTILNVFTNSGNAIQEITYYFRTRFTFPAATNGATLYLRTIVDDGAVFYLNGREMYRTRITTGVTPTYTNLASSSGSQSWSPSFTSNPTVVPLTNLVTGVNTLAVELHQRTLTDDDVTLGALLEAQVNQFVGGREFPAMPALRIQRTDSGDIVLSWDDSGWRIESTTSLAEPWTPVEGASPLSIPKAAADASGARFFRLARPE